MNNSLSQVVLKSEDMMNTGDTVRVSIADDNNIDFTSTGELVNWDYSYLNATSQRLERARPVQSGGTFSNIQFGPNAGRYASNYFRDFLGLPIDQLGNFVPLPINIEDVYRFTKIEEDSVSYTGLGLAIQGNVIPFRSDTIEVAYELPLSYGDEYSSRGYTRINLNPFFDAQFIQRRQNTASVDGWGTLRTPFGTFNAIRIHHIIDEQDSIFVNLDGFSQWIPINQPRTHIYEWWTKFQDLPLLKIETRELGGNETVTEIAYRDVYLGLDASTNEVESNQVSIFPNPTSDKIQISSTFEIDEIELRNAAGQLILHESINGGGNHQQIELNLNSFNAGIYFLSLKSKNSSVIKKIVLQ